MCIVEIDKQEHDLVAHQGAKPDCARHLTIGDGMRRDHTAFLLRWRWRWVIKQFHHMNGLVREHFPVVTHVNCKQLCHRFAVMLV